MSMNATYSSYEKLMKYLNEHGEHQCVMFNVIPGTKEYEVWVSNQPHYSYEELIKLEEKDNDLLREKIDKLTEENKKLRGFHNYFLKLYGKGLEVTNWHQNGDTEPLDDFIDHANQLKDLDYYLSLNYDVKIKSLSEEDGGGWFASIPLLNGCVADGKTPNKAVRNLEEAKRAWLEFSLSENIDIPEPRNK